MANHFIAMLQAEAGVCWLKRASPHEAVNSLSCAHAEYRCDYCRVHETDQPLFPFHIEHIVAKKHHGSDDLDNLAWSCHECNLAKSSNLAGPDPSQAASWFCSTRATKWRRHFTWEGATLTGLTPCGRA